jgi:3-hydroxyisobutyrate dehydrogenase-like beta-hydroxyacid dehydrogenase
MRVGFVGLGDQGAPIAQRMATLGEFETVVWARRAEPLAPFRGSAEIAGSLAELGQGLDVLSTCVFDAAGTCEVLFGPGGAADGMKSGGIVICHSTVAPAEIVGISRQAEQEFGLRVLDAPVSGGAPNASIGELVVMIGGDAGTLDEVMPVLETFSNKVLHLGAVGAAQQAKLMNSTILSAHIAIAHEAVSVARELGINLDAFSEVLRFGSDRSFGIEVYLGSGALEPMLQSQLFPTLTKDVGLLTEVLDDRTYGSVFLEPAQKLISQLKALDSKL